MRKGTCRRRGVKSDCTEVGTAAKVEAVATRQLNHHVLRGAAAGREALCKLVLDSVDEVPTGEEGVAASEAKEAED